MASHRTMEISAKPVCANYSDMLQNLLIRGRMIWKTLKRCTKNFAKNLLPNAP